MASLRPASFEDLVIQLIREPARQKTLFALPEKYWFLGMDDGLDLSVQLGEHIAGNPLGPAAGPHTQMAQNLLLSYAAGARILELKTVQANDKLIIPRPCIDIGEVGYNIEWSQELTLEQSLREYVAGSMLIRMFRHLQELHGPAHEFVFEMSVGYDLAGIRSGKVRRFLDQMRDAAGVVESLREEIPSIATDLADLTFDTHISGSVTLSTFHGCPPEEIESIAEFLIADCDLDVVIKMNPPMLGREKLEHLLHGVLGYHDIIVSPSAYEGALAMDEGVELCRRLMDFAGRRNRRFGVKFCNTLEVANHRPVFSPSQKVMYLSGKPLYVIAITLANEFRERLGPAIPVSFSGGIDQHNVAEAVACGLCPVTVCTDLLRPGGYGRMHADLANLQQEMKNCNADNPSRFILTRYNQHSRAEQQAQDTGIEATQWASLFNHAIVAEQAAKNPRYRAAESQPKKQKAAAYLQAIDCLACEKCITACPNAALFSYPLPKTSFQYYDLIVETDGLWRRGDEKIFEVRKEKQIACFADFCNECGNCDTLCPQHGEPHAQKPAFYANIESWQNAAPRDGFVFISDETNNERLALLARQEGNEYKLAFDEAQGMLVFEDSLVSVHVSTADNSIANVIIHKQLAQTHEIDMGIFHTLRFVCAGILDPQHINPINAGIVRE